MACAQGGVRAEGGGEGWRGSGQSLPGEGIEQLAGAQQRLGLAAYGGPSLRSRSLVGARLSQNRFFPPPRQPIPVVRRDRKGLRRRASVAVVDGLGRGKWENRGSGSGASGSVGRRRNVPRLRERPLSSPTYGDGGGLAEEEEEAARAHDAVHIAPPQRPGRAHLEHWRRRRLR